MSKKSINDENFKLTTEEALRLIDLLKEKVTETSINFPKAGNKIEFDVIAIENKNKFTINIYRGSINKQKCTYQGRTAINNIPLLRLDVTKSSHINPDGTKIEGTHLHIYREENDINYAIPFNIDNPNLYAYCLSFFEKFNLIKSSYELLYQTELEERRKVDE